MRLIYLLDYNRVGLTGSVSRFLEISERTFTQFMQGLSESHDRMTIVDCGQLKEAADSKLKGTIDWLSVFNVQGSHD